MKKLLIFTATALSAGAMLSAAQADQSINNYQTQTQQQQEQYKPDPNFKPTPHAIMDDEIAKNVHGILASSWISSGYPHVTFDVKNGTVTFRGVVDTREDKEKIEQAAKKLEGVIRVRNEISVGLPKSQTAMNNTKKNGTGSTATATSAASKDSASTDKDRIINMKLRERFEKMAPWGYETIVIATSNGVVTITGNLERVEDMQKISTEARHIEGVKSVTNKVTAKSHK